MKSKTSPLSRGSLRPAALTLAAGLLAAALMAPLAPALAADEFVVIVNKDNNNAVDQDFIAKAYRGDVKTWTGGGNVTAIALPEDNALRAAFDKSVLGKSPAQSRALWAQLTFSGKALPPKVVDTEADVVKAVSENRNAIGYVSTHAAGSSVRTIK